MKKNRTMQANNFINGAFITTMGIVTYIWIEKRDDVEVYKTAGVTTSTAGEIFIYLKNKKLNE